MYIPSIEKLEQSLAQITSVNKKIETDLEKLANLMKSMEDKIHSMIEPHSHSEDQAKWQTEPNIQSENEIQSNTGTPQPIRIQSENDIQPEQSPSFDKTHSISIYSNKPLPTTFVKFVLCNIKTEIVNWYIPEDLKYVLNLIIDNSETQKKVLDRLNSERMKEKAITEYFASPMIFKAVPNTVIAKDESISKMESFISFALHQTKCKINQMSLIFKPSKKMYYLNVAIDPKSKKSEFTENGFSIPKSYVATCNLPRVVSDKEIKKSVKEACEKKRICYLEENLAIKETKLVKSVAYTLYNEKDFKKFTSVGVNLSVPIIRQFKPISKD